MLTLVFGGIDEMKRELGKLGFVHRSDVVIPITPVCLSPVQTAEQQADALDAVFAKVDAASAKTSENAISVPEVKELPLNDNSGQTSEGTSKVTEVSETKVVEEKPPVVDETPKVEEPKPVTADDLRAACVLASRRVPSGDVYKVLIDNYSTKAVAEIPADKLDEAFKLVNALGVAA